MQKPLLYILLSLLPLGTVHSQDTTVNRGFHDPIIEWVGQFPPLKGEGKLATKGRFWDFLLGSNPENILIHPVAVWAKDTNDYFVLDQESGTVYRVKDKVGEMTQFHDKKNSRFNSLVGICSLSPEKILFTDTFINKIFYFTPGKKKLGILNDTLVLDRPTGIAYSTVNQEIWVSETNAHRISVLDENGQLIRRIGHRGTAPGEFNFPTSIWIDHSGKIFIVDAMNFRIQVYSPEGNILSVFGKPGDATGYFARPKGIATDSKGNIYIVDALYNTVQIFNIEGVFLYNFGSQGRGEGEFWMPSGIYIDDKDYIYVADSYNSRIQVFRLKENVVRKGGPGE